MTQRGLTEAKRKGTGVRFSNGDGMKRTQICPAS